MQSEDPRITMYREGKTYRQIAAAIGSTAWRVGAWLSPRIRRGELERRSSGAGVSAGIADVIAVESAIDAIVLARAGGGQRCDCGLLLPCHHEPRTLRTGGQVVHGIVR